MSTIRIRQERAHLKALPAHHRGILNGVRRGSESLH
jgi:hypothetical protein